MEICSLRWVQFICRIIIINSNPFEQIDYIYLFKIIKLPYTSNELKKLIEIYQ